MDTNQTKDPFDLWWEWVNKDPATDHPMIASDIHHAVKLLTEDARKDRAIVNEAVRTHRRNKRARRTVRRPGRYAS